MASPLLVFLFLGFMFEVKCFPAAVNESISSRNFKENRLLTVLGRRFHFNSEEVEATEDLIQDEENNIDPEQDEIIFRLQVEEIVRKLRTMSDEEMQRIRMVFVRNMGPDIAEEVFGAAEEIFAREKEANEELQKSFQLNEGEEEAFEELVEDTKDGRDPETEDMEFKLGLYELADGYDQLSPEQKERFRDLVEVEFGSEEAAWIFQEITKIQEEIKKLEANPNGDNGISLAKEKIDRVADDQENKVFWGELHVDVSDGESEGNDTDNGVEDFENSNSAQAAGADFTQVQSAGANPAPAQSAGANPVPAQAAGANPVPAQAAGANPDQAQSADANLVPAQSAAANPIPAQDAGENHVPAQAAGANPDQAQSADANLVQEQSAGANPVQEQTAGANPVPAQTAGANPVPAQTAGANPVPAQTAGANPVREQTTGTNPVPAQTAGANPVAAQTAGANPVAAQTAGANPVQDQTAGANPVQEQSAGASPVPAQSVNADINSPEDPATDAIPTQALTETSIENTSIESNDDGNITHIGRETIKTEANVTLSNVDNIPAAPTPVISVITTTPAGKDVDSTMASVKNIANTTSTAQTKLTVSENSSIGGSPTKWENASDAPTAVSNSSSTATSTSLN
ncbi:uncharacterized protein LOC144873482 [Branchiostoma floridae x Branchiostoma japonicum]